MNLFFNCIVPYGCVVHNYIFTGPIGDQGFYTHLYQGFMQNSKQKRPLSKECINIENILRVKQGREGKHQVFIWNY